MAAFEETPGLIVSKCLMMSHVSTTLLHVRQHPRHIPSPWCTHLFAHTFVCTYYIILMILFVYYCCFIDINKYIYIHIWREIYTHSFQFPGCLATSRLVMLFTGLLPRQKRHHLRTRRSSRAPLDPMKSHGSHMIL